jgi:3-oxoacyl-[acyl-carrier-protein] synthase II
MRALAAKITGIGPITPVGVGRDAFWNGIVGGAHGIRLIEKFRPDAGAFVGGVVDEAFSEPSVTLPGFRKLPRHTQFAVAASRLALKDAGVSQADLDELSVGVLVGAALMDFGTINRSVELILRRGPICGIPSSVTAGSVSSIGAAIIDDLGVRAKGMTFQSACCSGLDAIGHAAMQIASGEIELAICGGTEAPLYFHPMLEFRMAGLAPGSRDDPLAQCRPFDLWRTTGVIGEGACMLVLEPMTSPRPAYGVIRGYSYATDSEGQLCSGLLAAIRGAIANASLSPADIGALSAWGPGHREVDRAEAEILAQVFAQDLARIPAASIKGAIGNPLGAAGAIQAGGAALGLSMGIVPPTVNWQRPDPNCPLSLGTTARRLPHRNVLVNSHGLSGTNACLVITQ